MSEEEKEAIDTLQNCIADYVIGDYCVGKYCPQEDACKNDDCPFEKAIDTVINLIDKQQKEIKELKADKSINTEIHKRDLRIKELEELNEILHQQDKEDFISKDIIKAKIKKIENEYNKKFGNCKIQYYESELVDRDIRLLKELLGEENE